MRGGGKERKRPLRYPSKKTKFLLAHERKKRSQWGDSDPCFPRRNDTTVALFDQRLARRRRRHVNNNTQWRCIYTTAYSRHGRARPCVIGRDAYDSLDKYAAAAVYPPCRHRFGSPLAFSNATTSGCPWRASQRGWLLNECPREYEATSVRD